MPSKFSSTLWFFQWCS